MVSDLKDGLLGLFGNALQRAPDVAVILAAIAVLFGVLVVGLMSFP